MRLRNRNTAPGISPSLAAIADCNGTAGQQWYVAHDRTLRSGLNGSLCLDVEDPPEEVIRSGAGCSTTAHPVPHATCDLGEIAVGTGVALLDDMPIPRWGRVVAQPNEFLIQIRSGRVVRAGQGLSCFKWPWDSVAVLPTTLAKLAFVADQVTLEKVGVQVSGLAVYRIAEPLLAYRMIDGGNVALLGEVLREMFVGATRRIVSGLTLEACLTHRKERVAAELMREIAPVLAGEGAVDDATSRGWGVVIDTIEIQDVRVLSSEVFARLQAPYRAALQLEALRAEDQVRREEARLAEARATLEEENRLLRMEQEEARLLRERGREDAAREHARVEQDRAEVAEHQRELRRAESERERLALELQVRAERLHADLAEQRARAEMQAEATRLERAAVSDLSEARLQEILLTETMPRLAEAYRGAFGTVSLTQVQSGGAGLGDVTALVTAAVQHVVNAARGPG